MLLSARRAAAPPPHVWAAAAVALCTPAPHPLLFCAAAPHTRALRCSTLPPHSLPPPQTRSLHATSTAQAKRGAAAERQASRKNSAFQLSRALIPTAYSMDGKQPYIEWPLPTLPMRRQMKGRIPIRVGGSQIGTRHRFGIYGMQADTGIIYTQFQLDSAKEKAKRVLKVNKQARFFMRVFAQVPRTKKSLGARMGKGKGAIDHFVVRVPRNRMVMEVGGNVDPSLAKEALRRASHSLPGKLNYTVMRGSLRDTLMEEAKKRLFLHPIVPPFIEEGVDD